MYDDIINKVKLVDDKEILIYKGSGAGRPFRIGLSEKNYFTFGRISYTRDLIFSDGWSYRVLFDDKITFDVLMDNIKIFNGMYNKLNYMTLGDRERILFIKIKLSDLGW